MKASLLLALALFTGTVAGAAAQTINLPGLGTINLPTRSKPAAGRSTTTPKTASRVSSLEAASGLKEALAQGITKGAEQAGRPDGFYLNRLIRIPFPPDAQRVANTLRSIGLGSQVDKFELSLNRGAEDAATKAKPIFLAAIKSLTFADVWNILTGQKDAATQYLKRTTTEQLSTAFQPIIQQSLDKVGATRHYTQLSTTYNQLPLVTPVQTDLSQYTTAKAVDGLFLLIAQEEANIRENPVARTTALLKRVFGS